jgi:hypothetical protein
MLSFRQFINEETTPPDPSWMSSETQPRKHPLKAPADIKELGKFHGMNAHDFHPIYANNPHYQEGYTHGAMMIKRAAVDVDKEEEEDLAAMQADLDRYGSEEEYRRATGN